MSSPHDGRKDVNEVPAVAPSGGWHPDEPDAASPEETARALRCGRSLIYKAINPDPARRDGLPFLPSFKIGRCRRIRTETRRAWLKQLEEMQSVAADKGS